jgi:hypothetical protein
MQFNLDPVQVSIIIALLGIMAIPVLVTIAIFTENDPEIKIQKKK